MSGRTVARLAWALWALPISLLLATIPFTIWNWSTPTAQPRDPLVLDFGFLLFFILTLTVGALIASRQPSNPIGWLLIAVGSLASFAAIGGEYAFYALATEPGALPGARVMAWIAGQAVGASWIPLMTLIVLLFPDGRLRSRRWRAVALAAVGAFVCLFAWGFSPGPIANFTAVRDVQNPFGIPGAGGLLDAVGAAGVALTLATALAAALSLVLRFRRARGGERDQLKWLAWAGSILAVSLAIGPVVWATPISDRFWTVLFLAAVSTVPVALGFAILRYRLYDIDLVINRTLVYGALSGSLAGAYFCSVLLMQQLFRPLTSGSELAVAGSTLAVAAVFRPLRTRIQALVDRRFYRRRYYAARTLEAFSLRLRDEIDLEALSAELRAVVRETMQPAHVALWLRSPEARS